MAQQSNQRHRAGTPACTPAYNNGVPAPAAADATKRAPAFDVSHLTIVRYVAFLGVAILVVAVDQITKLIVDRNLKNAEPVEILGGVIRLDYTSNTGAAFGLFRHQSAVFAAVALVVGLGIVVAFYWLRHSSWPVRVGLSLILGGAAGNVVDRIRLGFVVDFIDLRWWPVFNLADSAVVIGVALLLLASVLVPAANGDSAA